MRFEAKHRVFKQWARMTSYKNLCLSLAMKYQQHSAYISQAPTTQTVSYSTGDMRKKSIVILIIIMITIMKLDYISKEV